MKPIFSFFLIIICLDLGHAQTAPPFSVPSLPTSISTPTTSPSTAPTTSPRPAAPPAPPSFTPQPVPAGEAPPAGIQTPKYAEHQSVCRTSDFDHVVYLSENIKEKRISLLQDKIKQEPESIKLKIRLLKEYADQKKIRPAELLLQEIRRLKTATNEMQMAEAYFAAGKSDKKAARDILNKLLAEQPKNVEALKLLADVYKSDANYFEYVTIYTDLAKITKENYDEQICEGLTLDSHYADAEKTCLSGWLETKNPAFSIYLGIASREQQKLKEAQKYFNGAIKLKESEMAYVCLGEIHMINKKFEDAEQAFQKAVELNPKSLRAHLALAWSYFNDKKRPQALTSFQSACALSKSATTELRRAVKILIDEKSEFLKAYSTQVENCVSI